MMIVIYPLDAKASWVIQFFLGVCNPVDTFRRAKLLAFTTVTFAAAPSASVGALSWKGRRTRFFLQLVEYVHNLNIRQAGRKNRWRQNHGDPK
jgi:hypothetical protein